MTNSIEKLIIIGSGPAGHTAAIYASRASLKPLMFEGWLAGGIAAGGQLTTTTMVENFPGRPDGIDGNQLMSQMRAQSINSGTRILTQTVDSVDFSRNNPDQALIVYSNGQAYMSQAIIIATGAIAKKLNIIGLDEYWMNGISGCAVCDGALPMFRNHPLVVIGGGDVAMEEAMHLAKFGSRVYILVRSDRLRASQAMQDRVITNDKITIMYHTECTEAIGTNGLLSHINIHNNLTGIDSQLEASGLFFAIGHTPNTGFLGGQIDLDDDGYIVVYSTLAEKVISGKIKLTSEKEAKLKDGKNRYNTSTSVSGVFAAGDVSDKIYRQAITSAGSGCMAALEAEKWLSENR